MSLVIADSRPESLTLIAAQHEDWIIQQAITLLEKRVFKAGPYWAVLAVQRNQLTAARASGALKEVDRDYFDVVAIKRLS